MTGLLYKEGGTPYIKKMETGQIEIWACQVCGFRYEEQFEKMAFTRLPDDWKCPICGAPKDAFLKL
jgi:rubredoxin